MKKSFNQILIKNSNIAIELEIKNHLKNILINEFLSNYRISNFWRGKFFVKRLIKKIFKYQLSESIVWHNNFWELISIDLYETEIKKNHNISLFEIKNLLSEKRYNDIIKYKELLLKDIELGHALYIHSNCLNLLGSKIKNENFYILDGSRRMIANVLLKKNPFILVISINESI
tara:strand:- start:160 stop:681 length:522 start_codon:yes stop_codon:yes gene_type:complete